MICKNAYVINLDRRPDRFDKINTRFTETNVDLVLNRVSAMDYKTYKGKLNDKQHIIAQSFIKCFEQIIQDNVICKDTYVLVMEDDVIFHKKFKEKLDALIIPKDILLVYLGSNDYGSTQTTSITHNIYGGFGILYNMSAIESVIIPQLKKYHNTYPYDNIIQHIGLCCAGTTRFGEKLNLPFVPPIITIPNLIIADVSESDVRANRDMVSFAKSKGWNLGDYNI